MAPRKPRPTPLRDLQTARADQSRRYLLLDPHQSLTSPYPFDAQAVSSVSLAPRLQGDVVSWEVCPPASSRFQTRAPGVVLDPPAWLEPGVEPSAGVHDPRWNDPLDCQDDNHLDRVPLRSLQTHRSFTPPISPPASSPTTDTEYSSKRSGTTFALVPAEVDGKHVFTHVVMNHRSNDSTSVSGPPSAPPSEVGLPEDMQDILRQLDDLASWVRAASSSRDRTSKAKSIVHTTRFARRPGTGASGETVGHPSSGSFLDKGKNRLPSNNASSNECSTRRDLVGPPNEIMPGKLTSTFPATDLESEGFIYVPNCNTPEFLVGSSNSPIAYPVCGYSSHPVRYSPHSPDQTHDGPYHRRFLERRSAPCPLPNPSLVSPPSGKASFKALFHRSKCNTTVVSRPSISSGHVPVEGVLRQGKRMRLPWLKI